MGYEKMMLTRLIKKNINLTDLI